MKLTMKTIKEISEDNELFHNYDWFYGSKKLVAMHTLDKSTEEYYTGNNAYILCSFRENLGFGNQVRIDLVEDSKLISGNK